MKQIMVALAVLLELSAFAQMEIGINQYLFNPYVLNPAFSGKEKCQNFSLGIRRQWVDLEITESIQTFGIDANLSKGGMDNFKSGWHGVGGQVVDQQSGNFKITRIMASYAYHLRIGKEMSLSFGSFVSVKRMALMRIKLKLKDKDDPVIDNSGQVYVFPEISPGVWFSSPDYFGGISVWNISHAQAKMLGRKLGDEAATPPHYFASMGMRIKLDNYFHFIPSTHIRFAQIREPSIDLNAAMQFGPSFKAGVGYRWQDALTANMRLIIHGKLSIGYGFDFTTSKLRYGAGNSHEVFITYTPCTKDGGYDNRFWCPAY